MVRLGGGSRRLHQKFILWGRTYLDGHIKDYFFTQKETSAKVQKNKC